MSETFSLNNPINWTVAKLEDLVIKFVGGGTPSKQNSAYYQGNIPWMSVKDMTTRRPQAMSDHITLEAVANSATNLIPPDTIIIATRMSLGKVVRVPFEVAINQDLKALILSKGIEKDFIEYWFLAEASHIQSLGTGTTVKGIRLEVLQQLEVPLPPLNEQRRIVAKIEALKARSQRVKEELEAIPALLDQFRQSVLAAAFHGDLTAEWREKNPDVEPASVLLERICAERRRRWEEAELEKMKAQGKTPKDDKWKERYKEPESLDSEELLEIPTNWRWARVDEVGKVQLGRQRAPQHHSGDYMRPYLRAANVFEDRIDTSDILEMNFNLQEYETYRLEFGDILLNEGQSKELVGRPAIYRGEVPGSCFQNTLVRFQAYDGVIPEYALIVFRGYMHTGRFQRIAQWTTNIAHLGAGRFAAIEFPLPPKDEQIEIVSRVKDKLTGIRKIEDAYKTVIGYLEKLNQSILAKAFRGELVPQDPNDEPASVLLERIRAEREKLDTKKKAKGKTEKKSRKEKPEPAEPDQLSLPGFD